MEVVVFVEMLVLVDILAREFFMHLKSVVWSTTCASSSWGLYLGKQHGMGCLGRPIGCG